MLKEDLSKEELKNYVGDIYIEWQEVCHFINTEYDLNTVWYRGGKQELLYECKFQKSKKTICSLFVKEKGMSFMIIFGREERDMFDNSRNMFSKVVQEIYDNSKTFHDGKWMMFEVKDHSLFEDIKQLIYIKKKPNRKY